MYLCDTRHASTVQSVIPDQHQCSLYTPMHKWSDEVLLMFAECGYVAAATHAIRGFEKV
jgi:hypothetical protein